MKLYNTPPPLSDEIMFERSPTLDIRIMNKYWPMWIKKESCSSFKKELSLYRIDMLCFMD